MKKDLINSNQLKVEPFFSILKDSQLHSQWRDLAEIRTHPSFHLIIYKNEEDPLKNGGATQEWPQHCFVCKSSISQTLKGSLLHIPWSYLAKSRSHARCYGRALYGSKNEDDPIKMKALKSSYYNILNFQTLNGSLLRSRWRDMAEILRSSTRLWLSSLHVRMKKIRFKMKTVEWSKYYTSIFQTLKGS